MADIIIRHASVDDAPAIAVMHRQSWLDTYSSFVDTVFITEQSVEELAQGWEKHIRNLTDKQIFLVAEKANEIIGITFAGKAKGETEIGEVYLMYVATEHTGKGLGTRLWQQTKDFMFQAGFNRFGVAALCGNAGANKFYHRMGGNRTNGKDFVTPAGQVLPQYRYEFQKENSNAGN